MISIYFPARVRQIAAARELTGARTESTQPAAAKIRIATTATLLVSRKALYTALVERQEAISNEPSIACKQEISNKSGGLNYVDGYRPR
jgi:hypothetical protein